MSKTAKIKQFKYAFLKPKQTKKDVIKSKTSVEKAIKTLKKGDDEEANNKLTQSLEDLAKFDENYLKELVQYKVVKHWDEPEVLKLWLTKCSTPEKNVELIRKVLEDNPSKTAQKDMVIDCWRRMRGQREIADLCYSLFPTEIEDEVVKVLQTGGEAPIPQDRLSKLTRRVFEEGNGERLNVRYLSALSTADAEACAQSNPETFIKVFVNKQGLDPKVKLLCNPVIREALKDGGKAYEDLVKATPLFAFLDGAKTRERPAPNKAATVIDSLFAEVLAPDGVLGLTYYTNSMTPIPNMLTTPKAEQVKAVQDRKESIKKILDTEAEKKRLKGDTTPVETDTYDGHPDGPGTQCDVLVSLMTTLIGATLGPDVECKHKVFKGMVLTDKMSKFPGGLLSSSFGGNVYDDSTTLTGQVLFTGGADDGVSNAHTILEVNGMQYDAVLGTSGKDLSSTVVDEYPAWDKTGYVSVKDDTPIRVSKSTKTDYWIINEPGLKAAPNKHGFATAYRMTNNPGKYIKPKAKAPEVTAEPKVEKKSESEDGSIESVD